MRIGFGRDIHRFVPKGRPFILGGVSIPFEKEIDAHSDGDVLLHALAEAIFGSLSLSDLGTYFDEKDPKNEGMDSKIIVKKALDEMKKRNYHLQNVDISVVTEKPHLREYISKIKNSLENILNLSKDCIALKAQTNEGCDAIGKGEAILCYVVLLIEKD